MGVQYMQQDPDLQNIDPAVLEQLQSEANEQKESESLFTNNDMVKMIKEYLHVDMPESVQNHDIVKYFWAILGRDCKLTFIDSDSEIEEFELLFNDALYNYLMQTPTYTYTFEDMQHLDQIKLYFLAAIRRAKGFPKHKFNERIIQGGTINQTIKSSSETFESPGQKKGGIMGALSKFF